mmetsp:Transcript_3691/g.10440  ORF Transcript_3691/g.10440 Transcript_3691/m.10440 type:complete len:289 (+) Transcript_3691:220-1086(+)
MDLPIIFIAIVIIFVIVIIFAIVIIFVVLVQHAFGHRKLSPPAPENERSTHLDCPNGGPRHQGAVLGFQRNGNRGGTDRRRSLGGRLRLGPQRGRCLQPLGSGNLRRLQGRSPRPGQGPAGSGPGLPAASDLWICGARCERDEFLSAVRTSRAHQDRGLPGILRVRLQDRPLWPGRHGRAAGGQTRGRRDENRVGHCPVPGALPQSGPGHCGLLAQRIQAQPVGVRPGDPLVRPEGRCQHCPDAPPNPVGGPGTGTVRDAGRCGAARCDGPRVRPLSVPRKCRRQRRR